MRPRREVSPHFRVTGGVLGCFRRRVAVVQSTNLTHRHNGPDVGC
jgi:hypothetical protein